MTERQTPRPINNRRVWPSALAMVRHGAVHGAKIAAAAAIRIQATPSTPTEGNSKIANQAWGGARFAALLKVSSGRAMRALIVFIMRVDPSDVCIDQKAK